MRLHLASAGLWRRRRDLATILGADSVLPPVAPGALATGFAGWGAKPSGRRAAALAARHGGRCFVVEDGFLLGHFAGRPTAATSYTIDTRAAHYEGSRASDLETAIRERALTPREQERARAAIAAIREARLTKYNDAPLLALDELGLADTPYVLLVEQVAGDLSLEGDGAAAFAAMAAEARAAWPDHLLVVRPHPAARGAGPLERAVRDTAAPVRVLRARCNPWPLLEGASRLYTHSSHLGFEALMAGTPVTVFGQPFYAGWGLSDDRAPLPRRGVGRDLETVFHAAYIGASRYLDLHDRTPATLERTVEALATLRDAQLRNPGPVVTGGLSPWKRRAVAPFLASLDAPPRHRRSVSAAGALARETPGTAVAVWGADVAAPVGVPLVRLEDGFVRSAGLGAALRLPLSLICERRDRLPFDARGVNGIERTLRERPPDAAEQQRAGDLVRSIVEAGVTKYMLAGTAAPLPATDRLKVLVVGQVETDASIRFGAPAGAANTAMLAAVRQLFPDALVAYRDHPDVASGLRPGRAERSHVDLAVDDHPIADLLAWCDRVETITSLTGFEALLRGKPVGTHGWPFYAGWGLTDDRLGDGPDPRPPRGTASLEQLAAAALLRVPLYIHGRSRLPCSPERAVASLGARPPAKAVERLLLHPAGLALGRLKHRLTGR